MDIEKVLALITDPAEKEEAKKLFMLQADYTKKTQDIAEKERQFQAQLAEVQTKLAAWDQFGQQMQPYWENFKAWHKQVTAGGPGAQPSNPNPAAQPAANGRGIDFSNWQYLPEEEKVNRILNVAETQSRKWYEDQLAAKERAWGQAIGNTLAEMNRQNFNYFNLAFDALGRGIKNPDLDLPMLLKEAQELQNQILQGKVNPLDLAWQKMVGPKEEEKKKAEYMKLGEDEYKRRIENEKQAAGVTGPGPVPIAKAAPKSQADITQAVRAEAEKAGIPWLSQ